MKNLKIILLPAVIFILAACTKYPPADSRMLEDLAVLTQYDVNTDFGQYHTFAIVDSIAYISDKDSGRYLDDNARALLNRISLNMINRGYLKVSKDDDPDFGINVSAIKILNVTAYYPGWYWGYPGYYPPYWWGYGGGYYYPYYPVYYTAYASGTLILDMINFKKKTTDEKYPIVWNAFIRGLLTGDHTLGELESSIDQAFTQTPAIRSQVN